ncbi:RNA polymerase-associated protein Rtf1p [[Candida] jaroonii]|uniref:RNA polymerase-associated protein Rtf1p n=1 Tax=[Candida] jaroonii TaxID=467808 RepID=A0ACA9Y6M2_9ASCO|nr:RNA polymerase-associated protein Rtf1p [[Candida] jaroonii]
MSDLDDDLLALAGVTDSEDESPKRKFEDVEPEVNELVNPYPLEGKYKNEQDREHLLDMDEVEREQILFDRSQEMERYNEKKFLQDRLKQQQADQAETKATRSSKRAKTVGGNNKKTSQLSELRKQREKKNRQSYSDDEDDEEEFDEEEDQLDEDDLDVLSDEYESKSHWKEATTTRKPRSYVRAEFKDIGKVFIGRSFMLKYCFYPKFEESIVGCYGRVNLGPNPRTRTPSYRMVKIIGVEHRPDKKYKVPNSQSDLYILVSQNKKQTKHFPMSVFSDSSIQMEEFNKYLNELNKNHEDIEYTEEINEVYEEISTNLTEKSLNDKEINQMIENKQKLSKNSNGFDAVFQKAQILDKLKIAKQQNRFEEVKKLSEELNKLETSLIETNNKQNVANNLSSMTKVNERNRKLNLENIKKAELKSHNLKRLNTGNDDGNPFLRLKTVTRVFYQDIINLENEKASKDAKINYEKLIKEKELNEKKIAESSYRVLGVMDELINEIDVDFEDIVV